MLCNHLLLFPTRPRPHSLFHYATTILPLFVSLYLTRTLGIGQRKDGLVIDIWFFFTDAVKIHMVRTKRW